MQGRLTRTLFFVQAVIFAAAFVIPERSVACGFCAGDKAASVYSFRNKTKAEKVGNHYVSVEVLNAGTSEDFDRAVKSLGAVEGVVKGSVRASWAQKAVSFVYEKNLRFDEILKRFSDKAQGIGLRIVEEIR